jgi:hypothetical protein
MAGLAQTINMSSLIGLIAMILIAGLSCPCMALQQDIPPVAQYGEPWIKPDIEKEIDWGGLVRSSFLFLGVAHSYRIATEPGTREGLKQPFFSGYAASLSSLRGWSDGDPFIVNYVGHPMQGAVSGFIWANHDRSFKTVEFGDGAVYWKSRLRAAAYSAVYSAQFEVGPFSEASIGQIQKYYPQHGFVDHVVTPVIGSAWMVAEDALDRHVIKRLERRIGNPVLLVFIRGGLNPARSFGNAMSLRVPWARDTRPGVFTGKLKSFLDAQQRGLIHKPLPDVEIDRTGDFGEAKVEISMHYRPVLYGFNGSRVACHGGGGEAAVRIQPSWQVLLDVSGCNLTGLGGGWTGDTLTYLTGPRWTPRAGDRWSPYLQAQVGGMQVTKETARNGTAAERTATELQTNRLAMSLGGGVDVRLHPAVALRLARMEYKRVLGPGEGPLSYNNGLSFSFGLVLRAGTW